MNIYLDEAGISSQLVPFTRTRHVTDIRVGILTIREKWALLGYTVFTGDDVEGTIHIPANILPTRASAKSIIELAQANEEFDQFDRIEFPWHIFQLNDAAIRADFELITHNRQTVPIPGHVTVQHPQSLFLEEHVKLAPSVVINASTGPVYIGKGAEIMEGVCIRGPFALGANSVVKMGATIYGGTSAGPNCVLGGEIKNTVIFGNSNKAHHGYLGDSVIGEWCNLGAGTSNSNVKNTGGDVKFQLEAGGVKHPAGMKAGLLMGDYTRAAINTSFNTGTVAGVCSNIFQPNPATFIPDFQWGDQQYEFDKAIRDINNWKRMKGAEISQDEINILQKLYSHK